MPRTAAPAVPSPQTVQAHVRAALAAGLTVYAVRAGPAGIELVTQPIPRDPAPQGESPWAGKPFG